MMWLDNLLRPDVILIYTLTIMNWIVFLISYLSGLYSQWYSTLTVPDTSDWITRIGWIIGTIFSFIGLHILWNHISIEEYLILMSLYSVGTFLMISWSVALFQGENIRLATWLSFIIFIYQLGLVLYIWSIDKLAALLQIPLIIMYLHLIYLMISLASLNSILL